MGLPVIVTNYSGKVIFPTLHSSHQKTLKTNFKLTNQIITFYGFKKPRQQFLLWPGPPDPECLLNYSRCWKTSVRACNNARAEITSSSPGENKETTQEAGGNQRTRSGWLETSQFLALRCSGCGRECSLGVRSQGSLRLPSGSIVSNGGMRRSLTYS